MRRRPVGWRWRPSRCVHILVGPFVFLVAAVSWSVACWPTGAVAAVAQPTCPPICPVGPVGPVGGGGGGTGGFGGVGGTGAVAGSSIDHSRLPGALAFTGLPLAALLVIAAVLVLAGIWALAITRRA